MRLRQPAVIPAEDFIIRRDPCRAGVGRRAEDDLEIAFAAESDHAVEEIELVLAFHRLEVPPRPFADADVGEAGGGDAIEVARVLFSGPVFGIVANAGMETIEEHNAEDTPAVAMATTRRRVLRVVAEIGLILVTLLVIWLFWLPTYVGASPAE